MRSIVDHPSAPELENWTWVVVPYPAELRVEFWPEGAAIGVGIEPSLSAVPTPAQMRTHGMQPWRAGWSAADQVVVVWIDLPADP